MNKFSVSCPAQACNKSFLVSFKTYPRYYKVKRQKTDLEQRKREPSAPKWYFGNIHKHLLQNHKNQTGQNDRQSSVTNADIDPIERDCPEINRSEHRSSIASVSVLGNVTPVTSGSNVSSQEVAKDFIYEVSKPGPSQSKNNGNDTNPLKLTLLKRKNIDDSVNKIMNMKKERSMSTEK